jgi:hypothetical protein
MSAGIAQREHRIATGWTVQGSNPGGEKISALIQTSFRAYTASHTFGTVSSLGIMWLGCGLENLPPIAPRLKKENSYNSTPLLGLRGLLEGEDYLYFYPYISSQSKHIKFITNDSFCNFNSKINFFFLLTKLFKKKNFLAHFKILLTQKKIFF